MVVCTLAGREEAGEWLEFRIVIIGCKLTAPQAHWRGLPIDVPPADIFVSYYYDGNAAFDGQTGERTHWLPKKKEDCSTYGCVEPGASS